MSAALAGMPLAIIAMISSNWLMWNSIVFV
jgi:hypothetical protein